MKNRVHILLGQSLVSQHFKEIGGTLTTDLKNSSNLLIKVQIVYEECHRKSPREPGRTEDEIVIRHYCLQGRDVDWK